MGRFEDECLEAHNNYRRKHGVPPLKYNRTVAAIAQKWADELAKTGRFQHSQDRKVGGDQLGENIAMKWSSSNDDFTGEQATTQWYEEISKYNFSTHSGPGTGHFTQVVWKDSRELGVGRAQAKDGKWLVVANYLPAGNYIGRHPQNVLPLGGGGGHSSSYGKADSPKSRFSDSPARVSEARVTHQPEIVRAYNTRDVSPHSSSNSKTVTKETRTTSSSGPQTYKKCVVTETTIGPDGKKTVVTRETVSTDNDGSDDFQRRFEELRLKHGFNDFANTRNNNEVVRDTEFKAFESNSSGDFEKQKKQWEKERKEREKKYEKERKEREKQMEKERKEREKQMEKERKEREKQVGKEKKEKSDDAKPQKIKDFIDDVIKAHNKYRKKHGKVGDFKQSKDLSVLAQRWADHLAATSVLKHSNDTYRGDQLGENVATKWSSVGADYNGQEVTEQWYNEIEQFDFRRNDFKSGTGHFTQVVWKGSKEIGVGKAFGTDGRVFVVCNYLPAGNVIGRFKENVFPA